MDWSFWKSGAAEASEFEQSLRYSDDGKTVNEFLKQYGDSFPRLVRVAEGFYAIPCNSHVTYGQLLLVQGFTSQRRLVVKDSRSSLFATLPASRDVVLKACQGDKTLSLDELSKDQLLPFEGVVQPDTSSEQTGRSRRRIARAGDTLHVTHSITERVLVARSVSCEWPMISEHVTYLGEATPLVLHTVTLIRPSLNLELSLPAFLKRCEEVLLNVYSEPELIPEEVTYHKNADEILMKNEEQHWVPDIYRMLELAPVHPITHREETWTELVPRIYAVDKTPPTSHPGPPLPPRSPMSPNPPYGTKSSSKAFPLPPPTQPPPPPPVKTTEKVQCRAIRVNVSTLPKDTPSSSVPIGATPLHESPGVSAVDLTRLPHAPSTAKTSKTAKVLNKVVRSISGVQYSKENKAQPSKDSSVKSSTLSPEQGKDLAVKTKGAQNANTWAAPRASSKITAVVPPLRPKTPTSSDEDYDYPILPEIPDLRAAQGDQRRQVVREKSKEKVVIVKCFPVSTSRKAEHNPVGEQNQNDTSTRPKHEHVESLSDVPTDAEAVTQLSISAVADCLRKLNLHKYVQSFADSCVDGYLLLDFTEQTFTSRFNMDKFDARRLYLFANEGYRPN